jgi:hypothetical protein
MYLARKANADRYIAKAARNGNFTSPIPEEQESVMGSDYFRTNPHKPMALQMLDTNNFRSTFHET